jgi:hypothetical protein
MTTAMALYAPGDFRIEETEPGRRSLLLTVHGEPHGQGALSGGGKGGAAYYTNKDVLLPWRGAVTEVAMAATGWHPIERPKRVKRLPGAPKRPRSKEPARCLACRVLAREHGWLATVPDYAVGVDIVVTFAPLKSDPNRPHATSTKHGDGDHHWRAIGDGMNGVVYPDDVKITDGHVVKTYPGRHKYALDRPGAVIRVWEIPA